MDSTSRRSKRLGKGLSALIPEINEEIEEKDIIDIKLSNILKPKTQQKNTLSYVNHHYYCHCLYHWLCLHSA